MDGIRPPSAGAAPAGRDGQRERPPATGGALALLLAVVLLLLAGGFAVATWLDHRQSLEEGWRRAEAAAAVAAEHAARALAVGRLLADRIEDDVRRDGLGRYRGEAWRDLAAHAGAAPEIGSVWVIDASGRIAATSLAPEPPEGDFSDRPYFAPLRDGADSHLMPLAWGAVSRVWFFSVNHAVRDDAGRFIGIVQAAMHAEAFDRAYAALTTSEGARIGLFRPGDGAPLMLWPPPPGGGDQLVLAPPPPESAPLRAAAAAGGTAGRLPLASAETGPVLLAWRRAGRGGETLAAAALPRSAVLGPFQDRLRRNGLLVLLVAGLVGGLGWATADAQRRRAAEESRWRGLTEAAAHLTWVMRRDGTLTFASRRWHEFTGVAAASMPPADWAPLVHPADLAAVQAGLTASLAAGLPFEARLRLRRADGAWRRVLTRAEPLPGDAGGELEWIGTTLDIEEWRAAEEALGRSEATLAAVLDALPVGVVVAGPDGSVLRDNAANRELWGLPADGSGRARYAERIGTRPETGAPIGPEEWALARALRQGEVVRGELVEARRFGAGGTRVFLNSAAPIRDAEGRILGAVAAGLDVTERRAAEEALAASEARLRRVLDNLFAFVGLLTPEGKLIEANRAPLEAAGLTIDDVRGRYFWDCPWWSYDAGVQAELRAACARAAAGESLRYDVAVQMAGGRRMVIDFQIAPLRDAAGRITHLVPSATDIDDRVATTTALAESEARLRAFAEHAPAAIYIVDALTGRLDFLSPAYEAIWGEPRAAILADPKRWDALLHPEDRAEATARQRSLYGPEAKPVAADYRIRRASDGAVRHVHDVGVPLRDASGRVVRVIGIAQDVTEQRAAEAALRESEARLRLATEAGQVGVFDWDLESGALRWDARLCAIFGVPEAAPVSIETFFAALHPEDQPRLKAAIAAALEPSGDGAYAAGFRIIGAADGALRHVEARGRVSFENGRPRRMIGTAVDVTAERQAALVLARDRAELEGLVEARTAELMRAAEERRSAEEAARQAEKLAALGQLTGGVAHDFNNLLQVVASGATLLKRPGLSEARRTAILDGMASACQNARELTSRLLSFARRQTLRPELLDLNGRLDGMAELLRRTLGATVRLETRFAADLWPVLADPGQLEVALLNLAVNARDAMPEGGTMRIETRNATLPPAAERAAGDYVCLTVSDTGEGMTPAVLARVFEPFFTTKENGRGTGLGLPQVFGFAKQSGGDIEVRSAPGQGTMVTLHLPRAATGSERERPLASGAVLDALRSSAGRTVLVVDDNAAAAEFAAALLEELGYAMRRAAGSAAALALLDGGPPVDAVFSDIVMPGETDGIGLAAALRRTHPRLPVVLTTGYSARAAAGGMPPGIELLPKPYRMDELAAALRRAFAAAAPALRDAG